MPAEKTTTKKKAVQNKYECPVCRRKLISSDLRTNDSKCLECGTVLKLTRIKGDDKKLKTVLKIDPRYVEEEDDGGRFSGYTLMKEISTNDLFYLRRNPGSDKPHSFIIVDCRRTINTSVLCPCRNEFCKRGRKLLVHTKLNGAAETVCKNSNPITGKKCSTPIKLIFSSIIPPELLQVS